MMNDGECSRSRRWIGVAIVGGLVTAALVVAVFVSSGRDQRRAPVAESPTVQQSTTESASTEALTWELVSTAAASTAPTTTYPTSYGTTPMPVGSFPIAAPDVPLPALTLVDSHVVGAGETVTGGDLTSPVYQFDASGLVVLQASPCCVSNSPAAYQATAYAFDGSVRWSVTVPPHRSTPGTTATLAGAVFGPDEVLYVSWAEHDGTSTVYILEAYATRGSKAGTMLGSWPTDWECTEMSWCGDPKGYLDTTGFVSAPNAIAYVNNDGQPSGATMPLSALPGAEANRAEFDYWPLENPTGRVLGGLDEFGNNNSSMRTRVRLGTSSWTFDAFGVNFQEGSFVGYEPQPGGKLMGWFEACAQAGCASGARQHVVSVLEAPAKVSMYSLPLPSSGSIRAESIVGHEIYGVNFDGKFLNLVRYRIPG